MIDFYLPIGSRNNKVLDEILFCDLALDHNAIIFYNGICELG
jgi:hypothetical protein